MDKNWTDDLPACPQTGIGSVTNHAYKEHGFRQEKHENEDRYIHFKLDDEGSGLYGVFDGYLGSRAAQYAAQQLPSEIIFSETYRQKGDSYMKRLLRQAFSTVEQSYFDSLSAKIAERDSIRMSAPHEPDPGRQRSMRARQEELDDELSSGCTALVALLRHGRVYLAHVGNCRALLCRQDAGEESDHRVQKLTSEHTAVSPEERQRLSTIGLTVTVDDCLVPGSLATRCIGDHRGKGDYRQWPMLAVALSEPMSALPELVVGLEVDPSWRFLILASAGLCDAVREVVGSAERVNAEIVKMVIAEAKNQTNPHCLAKAVVNSIVEQHHQRFLSSPSELRSPMHEDLTLLIRRFDFPFTSTTSDAVSLATDSPDLSLNSQPGSLRSDHTLTPYVDFQPWEAAMAALSESQREDFRKTLAAGHKAQRSPAPDKIDEESEAGQSQPTSPVSAPPGSEHRRLTPLPDSSSSSTPPQPTSKPDAPMKAVSLDENSTASSSCYVDGDM